MSRLTDLLRQLEGKDAELAADLKREFEALSKRRAFGLNFERHVPETVELPGRPIRRGDKVRFLPERGNSLGGLDRRLWRVKAIRRTGDGKMAELVRQDDPDSEPETATHAVADLVVVAEFRDPIYPGLVSTGKVERGGEKPFHIVINAENFHALQALLYTHEGKVDAIYIDPPYNTGARDWKYNNDYVDSDDAYRHSKWLAMMERRLKLAKRLLNPENSVLIVTIDEKEYLRLGLLLEQVFPGCDIQMISSVINPKGSARQGRFSRTDEYLYFVFVGNCSVAPWETDMIREAKRDDRALHVRWAGLLRHGEGSARSRIPSLFYPIFLNSSDGSLHSVGEPLAPTQDRNTIVPPEGTVAMFPVDSSGRELMWRLHPPSLRQYIKNGYARFGKRDPKTGYRSPYYLQSGTLAKIENGDIKIAGKDEEGALILQYMAGKRTVQPMTLWNRTAHSASEHGASILKSTIPQRKFPYPKSLYAVEDTLRFFVGRKPNALIVDFFSGSGTTAHAVMRLNRQDGGQRQSVLITNNEVSADEQTRLGKLGLRPGDREWEELGICEYITKPRISAAITGRTPDGKPVQGNYKFTDQFPMADGFAANVEFFTMTYEAPRPVAHHRSFEAIAPLLWLKAGAQGRRIKKPTDVFEIADTYAILFDLDQTHDFIERIGQTDGVRMAFIVTDDDRAYQAVCAELPAHVEPVRLYESYLTSFAINTSKE